MRKHSSTKTIIFSMLISCLLICLELFTLSGDLYDMLHISENSSILIYALILLGFFFCILHISSNYAESFLSQFIIIVTNTLANVIYLYDTDRFDDINSKALIMFLILLFAIPYLLSLLHHLLCQNDRATDYPIYFRNSLILFSIYYVIAFITLVYIKQDANSLSTLASDNYIPFYTIADYIERFIYKEIPLADVIKHAFLPTTLYIPFGFILASILHRCSHLPRIILCIAIPCLLELIGKVFVSTHFNIDDSIYGILGSFFGELIFFLINWIFIKVKRQGILDTRQTYSSFRY